DAPIGWADKAKGQVSVPIERAMELVENDIQRDPFLATVAPPPSAVPTGAPGDAPAPTGSVAAPTGSGSALEKAPEGDQKTSDPKAPAPTNGKLVDPPSGAPVTPAGAPAPKK